MSAVRPKWKQLERYCLRHGYDVRSDGGDKVIVAPPNSDPSRMRQTVRIGHRHAKPGVELPIGHIKQLKRAFGITPEDILGS
jgi:hypothetical protein